MAKSMDLKEEVIMEEELYLNPEMNNVLEENNKTNLITEQQQQQMVKFPRTISLTHLLEMDSYLAPISHLLSDASYNSTFDYQINTAHNNAGNIIDPFAKPQVFEVPDQYYATSSSTSQHL